MTLEALKDTVVYTLLKEQQQNITLKIRAALNWESIWGSEGPINYRAFTYLSTRCLLGTSA